MKKAPPYRAKSQSQTKTEKLFADRLQYMKLSGEISDYGYQRITFTIAPAIPHVRRSVRYTPDFDAVFPDHVRFYEVKAIKNQRQAPSFRKSAMFKTSRIKIYTAAELYSCFGFSIAIYDFSCGTWDIKPIN